MITQQQFNQTMKGLYGLLPFAKNIPPESANLAWVSFPDQAKRQFTQEILDYAAGQLLMDPDPDKEKPPHLALLRYVYRNENGQPNLDWGLKQDLPQRMAKAGQFNPEPKSEAALVAAGELPAYDGPRHAPGGVLAQLQQGL